LRESAGVRDENIILDPGIGFGKTVEQNLELLDRLEEIREHRVSSPAGTLSKIFYRIHIDLPPDKRIEGTAAAAAVGIVRGADILRIHDVEYLAQVVRMTDAIVQAARRNGINNNLLAA
jgi:dihydropteroate synthase